MKHIDTSEMLEKNFLKLKEKRLKMLQENEERIKKELVIAPDINEKQVQKQLAWIEKYTYIENKTKCILLTNSDIIKAAYNKMIKNEDKTVS